MIRMKSLGTGKGDDCKSGERDSKNHTSSGYPPEKPEEIHFKYSCP